MFLERWTKNGVSHKRDPVLEYLDAYNACEDSIRKAQGLVDALENVVFVLSRAGATAGHNDAWKWAQIEELGYPVRDEHSALSWSLSLAEMPSADEILKATREWHEKRKRIGEMWDKLPAEARTAVRPPKSLG
jgi:hypothetical protein